VESKSPKPNSITLSDVIWLSLLVLKHEHKLEEIPTWRAKRVSAITSHILLPSMAWTTRRDIQMECKRVNAILSHILIPDMAWIIAGAEARAGG
jgi:hypothetical protein